MALLAPRPNAVLLARYCNAEPATEKALAKKVKIPKSKARLKRPLSERHALLLIEKDNAWIRSRNRELAETFATLVTRGDPVTVAKTSGVIVWGIYAGEPQETGTIIEQDEIRKSQP